MMNQLITMIDELPDNLWNRFLSPLLGAYDGSKDHNLLSLIFYWRELFHIAGGLVISLIAIPCFLLMQMPKIMSYLAPIIILGVIMGLKEFLLDAAEQSNGWDFKNVVDTLAWVSGASIVPAILIYFKI